MLTRGERKTAGTCLADLTWRVGHTEMTLSCDLYSGHSMPRHRTVVDPTMTIFWESK